MLDEEQTMLQQMQEETMRDAMKELSILEERQRGAAAAVRQLDDSLFHPDSY